MPNLLRTVLAVVAALAFTAVPTVTVLACSCMEMPFNQAVAEADLAIVGTLVASDPPAQGDLDQPIAMEWAVERSRDPLDVERVTIVGWPDNGANCGVSFEVGQRWLLLAYRGEGALETNGCMQNRSLAADDPEASAIADAFVTVGATQESPSASSIELPMPLIVGGAALLLVALMSLLAFRRRAPGEG